MAHAEQDININLRISRRALLKGLALVGAATLGAGIVSVLGTRDEGRQALPDNFQPIPTMDLGGRIPISDPNATLSPNSSEKNRTIENHFVSPDGSFAFDYLDGWVLRAENTVITINADPSDPNKGEFEITYGRLTDGGIGSQTLLYEASNHFEEIQQDHPDDLNDMGIGDWPVPFPVNTGNMAERYTLTYTQNEQEKYIRKQVIFMRVGNLKFRFKIKAYSDNSDYGQYLIKDDEGVRRIYESFSFPGQSFPPPLPSPAS